MKKDSLRRSYTHEFKERAMALAASLKSTDQAEKDLGIPFGLIRQWKRRVEMSQEPAVKKSESAEEELRRLREENEKLKKVNHILKAAAAFFSQDHLK